MLLMLIAWGAVAMVAVLGFAQFFVEWRALGRVIRRSRQPKEVRKAVDRLHAPYRPIFRAFVDGTQRTGTVDDALTRALVEAAKTPFAPPPMVHTAAVVGTVVAIVAPLSAALFTAGAQLAEVFANAQARLLRDRYLEAPTMVRAVFSDVVGAFDETAAVVAALAAAWAFRWWLLRPEVREARLARALVICAGRLRPGAYAPTGARLAELLSPERSLTRPAVATGLWIAATTGGWLMLLSTADLVAHRGRPQTFAVWPDSAERRFEPKKNITLPRAAAGAPIVRSERPSLTFSFAAVSFHDVSLTPLVDGTPPPTWRADAPSMEKQLADFPRPLEVIVLGHRDVPLATVTNVLSELTARYGVTRYHLVIERDVEDPKTATQAVLPLSIADRSDASLTLRLQNNGVRLLPSRSFASFSAEQWNAVVRKQVRLSAPVWKERTPPAVSLETGYPITVSYGRFIDVLAAADGACATEMDCGLPGLGLTFFLRP